MVFDKIKDTFKDLACWCLIAFVFTGWRISRWLRIKFRR